MIVLHLNDGERAERTLHPNTIAAAKHAVEIDGYVVLDRVVTPYFLDQIYLQMLRDIERYPSVCGKPFAGGNLLPSRDPSLLFTDILHNPFVADVLSAVMGPEPSCGMYSSNVTMPGRGDQQLHVDMAPRKVEENFDYPTREMVVNIPVIDFTIQNGATEIWAGSHKMPRKIGDFWVNEDQQKEMRGKSRVDRAVAARGSAIIRDMRIWHRGIHNATPDVRPMISMICNGAFEPEKTPVEKIACLGTFPEAAREKFESNPRIRYHVTYQPDMPNYLKDEKQK